jgi:hypothetical protein
LLEEENLISLRTAEVCDDGYMVFFRLSPRSECEAPQPGNYTKIHLINLYRRKRSFCSRIFLLSLGETQKGLARSPFTFRHNQSLPGKWFDHLLLRRMSISLERGIKVMEFTTPPEFKLLWSNSGHSVALLLNGEAWAFIREGHNHGYSKGIIESSAGNVWNQKLFEETFAPER